jgi:pimeloyl-ACP methyl ester carboxylesterase
VFIQGWPDDASLWDAQVAVLSPHYRCVRLTMPNFGGKREVRWGYRTDEIIEALAAMIRSVSGDKPVTLILHDWGCYWGYATHARYPTLANRVVGCDVAPHIAPTLKDRLLIYAYQGWLALAFILDGRLGDWMTRLFGDRTDAPKKHDEINSWMGYPYRNIYSDMLHGRRKKYDEHYWPDMPLLFVWGTKKPVKFHSKAWIDWVTSHGEVVSLEASHWVQRNPGFNGVLTGFLDRTDPP